MFRVGKSLKTLELGGREVGGGLWSSILFGGSVTNYIPQSSTEIFL